jgi:hypothetical protein
MKIYPVPVQLSFSSFVYLGILSLLSNLLCPPLALSGETEIVVTEKGVNLAAISATDISVKHAFAMRCSDPSILTPYSRGYLEWTSVKIGPNPPVPSFTMTVAIERLEGGVYRELRLPSVKTLTAFVGKFSAEAISPNLAFGQFKGYKLVNVSGVRYQGAALDEYDLLICRDN